MEENANELRLRNSFVNLFAVYPLKYQRSITILYSWLNTTLIVD